MEPKEKLPSMISIAVNLDQPETFDPLGLTNDQRERLITACRKCLDFTNRFDLTFGFGCPANLTDEEKEAFVRNHEAGLVLLEELTQAERRKAIKNLRLF